MSSQPARPATPPPAQGRRVRWRAALARIRPPPLTAGERRILLLLGTATFFNQYDQQLFSLALAQIQAELAIPEAQLGFAGSLIRLGALPAFGVLLVADRIGRRAVLLWTIAGYTVFTAASAFAPDYRTLVALQLVARMFMAAEHLLAFVCVVEEFRPGNRGWGVALLGTLALLGAGAAMILFGAIEWIPYGWRGLYLVGVAPLLLVAVFRRRLHETERFRALAAERARRESAAPGSWRRWLSPVRSLARRYPGRFAAVGAVAFLWAFSNGSVDFFLPKYVQEAHGWSPARFATVAVLGGALGLSGQLLAGRASDELGRRPTFVLFLVLEPLAAIALYTVGAGLLVPCYVAWVFCSVGNDVLRRTFGGELFPTSARSTAKGALALLGTAGMSLGLAAEGLLFAAFAEHATPIRLVAATGLVLPVLAALLYPETRGRELEEIAPEEGAALAPARRLS